MPSWGEGTRRTLVNDRAVVGDVGRVRGHEPRVVVVRNEADLLAVGLVRDGQLACPRIGAHRLLGSIADGEHGVSQLILRQRKQEIRLILGGIDGALEQISARRVTFHACVVSGRDRVGAEAGRAIDERRELQVAVAMRAGKGRAARGVLPDEVRDDLLVELPLEIQDVVWDTDRRCHFPSIVQIVERTAAAEGGLPLALVVELHRQTNHVVTLLGEQGRGDRGVDAAGHRDHNSHH
jgi:hypothetical protein